jgi:type II secretory pathway pseudopilin PulG
MRRDQAKVRGFTALEALVAATILAFLTAAVSGALMAGRQQSKVARDTLYASMLARALLDEILRLPTTDPLGYTTMGPDSGEVRIPVFGSGNTQFNCVKDYNGYTDGPGMVNGQLQTTQITQLALTADSAVAYPAVYQPFVRTVSVTPVTYTPTGWNQTATGLLVTVTVSRDGMALVTLQRVAFY